MAASIVLQREEPQKKKEGEVGMSVGIAVEMFNVLYLYK